MFYIYDFCKGLCLFRGVVHVVHLGVVMLQLLYIWYIMTFVCSTRLGQVVCCTCWVLDILTSCQLYMCYMFGVIIHTCWNCLLASKWRSSGAVFSHICG